MNIPETYNQLDQWTTVMFLYNSALKAINTKIEILNNEFIHLYNYNPIEHIKSRLKTPESIVKKLKRGGYEVTIPIYLSDGPVDTKVEIQIRTIAMDFWASLEHKIYYKFEGNAPDYLEQELKACADMADMLDNKMFSLNQAITKIAEEQAKEKEAAKVAEEMKKAEREDVPAGNEQEPKDGKRSGEAASGNRKEAGE